MRTHAKRTGLAFLALAAGLMSGCGGESGGLPSGLGGALQGVRLNTNLVAISLTDPRGVEGKLPPELVTGVTLASPDGGGSSPVSTGLIRIVVKGGGLNKQDVDIDIPFTDPTVKATDGFANDPSLAVPANDVLSAGAVTRIRCYVYPVPGKAALAAGSDGGSTKTPILVRLDPAKPAGKLFEFADGSKAKDADSNALLNDLNASAAEESATIAGLRTVRYEPNTQTLLRRATLDVALEFYSEGKIPGTDEPFFVSYLKGAAQVDATTKQLTIKPESLSNDSSVFDPARRFARPITGKLKISKIPNGVRTIRMRVTEYDPQNPAPYLPGNATGTTRTTYERVISQEVPFQANALEEKIIFLNRLRPVAVQVEAFLGDAAGASSVGTSLPAIAVGRLYTTGSPKNLTPEIDEVTFSDLSLVNRVKANGITALYSGTRTGTSYNAVPKFPGQFNLRADLITDVVPIPNPAPAIGDPGPFDTLDETTIVIPASSKFIELQDADGNAIGATADDTVPPLDFRIKDYDLTVGTSPKQSAVTLTLLNVQDGDTQASVQPGLATSLRLSTDSSLGAGSPATTYLFDVKGVTEDNSEKISVPVAVVAPSDPVSVIATISGLPKSGSTNLAGSVVVKAVDINSPSLVYLQTIKVSDIPASGNVSVQVADRGAPFKVTVSAYTSTTGDGALLASGTADNVVLNGTTPPSIALSNKVSSLSLTYSLDSSVGTTLTFSPLVTVQSTGVTGDQDAPTSEFTYAFQNGTAPTGFAINGTTGVVTVSDVTTVATATVVATYRGAAVSTTGAVTTTQTSFNVTIAPAFDAALATDYGSYGSALYTLSEATVTSAYTTTSTTAVSKTLPNVLARGHDFTPKVELYSGPNHTGIVLASGVGSAFSLSGATGTRTVTLTNLVTDVDGATVGGASLEGFTFVRNKTYKIAPTLALGATTGQLVPITLLTVTPQAGKPLSYNATTGDLTVTADASTVVTIDATITLTYTTGRKDNPTVSHTFNVKIAPASGSIGGTIG